MEFEDARPFLQRNHRGVITVPAQRCHARQHRRLRGVPGAMRHVRHCPRHVDGTRHLRHDPRCTVLAVTEDWRCWVSVEGEAQLLMRGTPKPSNSGA